MSKILGVFIMVGVISVFACVTLWAADWIQNYDETGRYE
jgi:hypothetical protein